jgi:hypothetical protein
VASDDLALLKGMYQRGEITDEQYDVLRRHVLWGTPLPELVDEAAPPPPGPSTGPRHARTGAPTGSPRHTGHRAAGGRPGRPPPPAPGAPVPPMPRDSPRPPPPAPPPARHRAPDAPPGPLPARHGATGANGPTWTDAPSGPLPTIGPTWPGTPAARMPAGPPDRPAPPARPGRTGPRSRPPTAAPDAPSGPGSTAGPPWSDPPSAPVPPARPGRTGQRSRPRTAAPDTPSGPLPTVPAVDRDASGPIPVARPDPGRQGRRERSAAAADTDRRGGRRARRGPRLFVVLTSLLLAVALTGAGVWWFVLRSTSVEPTAYAQSVCGSVRDWQQDVDGQTSALTRSIAQQTDPGTIRTAVVSYYTTLAHRTDALYTALIAAGIPDLSGGRAYAEALTRAVSGQSSALRDSAQRASRLDTANRSEFQASLQGLLDNESTPVTAVITALAHPAGAPAQLRAALADEPACAAYTG